MSSAPLPLPGSGDVAGQLFASHHGWLLTRLQARLRHLPDAQDLASETFVRVLAGQRPEQLAALREPRAFLTTVARRLLISFWRRRDLEQAWLEVLAQAPPAFAPSPEERAVLVETLAHVGQALEGLPLKARQAFLLSQLDGLGYQAIADQLAISQSTVRRYMAEGFRRIALALDRQQAGIALVPAPTPPSTSPSTSPSTPAPTSASRSASRSASAPTSMPARPRPSALG